jgi:uridine kinase
VTIVGIAGGTGSGKSTLGRRLVQAIGPEHCALIAQDNYYHDLSHLSVADRAAVNFDHPDSVDHLLLAEHLRALRQGEPAAVPAYDFAHHVRVQAPGPVLPRPVVLVEGILVLVWAEVSRLMDVKIYVDAPSDVRLARRVRRDIVERGREVDGVLAQYLSTVRPMHDRYSGPSVADADLVVPGIGDNEVVVRLLARALTEGRSGESSAID